MKNVNRQPIFTGLLKRRFGRSLLVFIAVFTTYLCIDYFGPNAIRLKEDQLFGIDCLKANELVVQQFDERGTLWATRGMIIYKLIDGDNKFNKVAHVPTGFSPFWIRNFSLVRKLTIRPECMEIVVSGSGEICAMSGGHLWKKYPDKRKFRRTLTLSHYGLGDQGIRNDGIVNANDSIIYFGEYFQNSGRNKVRVFKSLDFGGTWEVAYEFKPGEIRHIHAIQQDPYTGDMWTCTGDLDEESMLAWSSDNFLTVNPIGKDNSMWRVCQLVFTEDAVYWGTDTGTDFAGIYKWSKDSMKTTKIKAINGAVFFATRLANGIIVMSTDREGMGNEEDDKTRIFLLTEDDSLSSLTVGTWQLKKPDFLSNFATLRFQRDQGAHYLAITCINQKEFKSGELIIISEDDLINAKDQNRIN